MSKRAEERGLEAVPPRWRKTKDGKGKVDSALPVRKFYIRAYEQAQKDLGWISVLERLPEPGEWVLVCIDDCGGPQCLSLATYDERPGIWTNDRDEMVHLDYWMPIPELPKK